MVQEFFEKLLGNTETKPFWQSSEFYVILGAAVYTLIGNPNETLTQLIDGLAATYGASRGLAKAGSSKKGPEA